MGSRAKAGLSFEIPVHPPNLIRHDEEMGGCLGVRSIQIILTITLSTLAAFLRTSRHSAAYVSVRFHKHTYVYVRQTARKEMFGIQNRTTSPRSR
jgi:hypothetical protein